MFLGTPLLSSNIMFGITLYSFPSYAIKSHSGVIFSVYTVDNQLI